MYYAIRSPLSVLYSLLFIEACKRFGLRVKKTTSPSVQDGFTEKGSSVSHCGPQVVSLILTLIRLPVMWSTMSGLIWASHVWSDGSMGWS